MPRRSKPPVLLIVGIMNLVLGIPCLCCMGFAMVGTAMQTQSSPAGGGNANANANAGNPFAKLNADLEEQDRFRQKEVAGWKPVQIVVIVIAMAFSIALMVSGIGLILGQAWGRWMCIAACALMMVVGLGNAVWRAAVVLPAQQRFADQQIKAGKAPSNQGGMMAAGGIGAVLLDILWSMGYPALAIGLLMTGGVRRYFSAPRRVDTYDDEFDDRRDDDHDRRRDDYE
jgi:hypothetical protein